jgi:SAM-dependent methyltransferase
LRAGFVFAIVSKSRNLFMERRRELNKILKYFWWRGFTARIAKKFWELRAQKTAKHLILDIPDGSKVLDIGGGSGMIAEELFKMGRKNITLLDVFDWNVSKIPLVIFDGKRIPFSDKEFDVALLIDVVHHSEDEEQLVSEALRVAKKVIVSEETHGGRVNFFVNISDNIQYFLYGMPLGLHCRNHTDWLVFFKKLSPVVSCGKKYFNHSIFIFG